MNIRKITSDKKQFLGLLLLADEQESMIDRYIDRGEMFVLDDGGTKAVAVVTDEGNGCCELKNMAGAPECHRQGYGKALLSFLLSYYKGRFRQIIVGTGETPRHRAFYEHCGFTFSHRVEGFFTRHYDHPIIDDGVVLEDMIYYKQDIL